MVLRYHGGKQNLRESFNRGLIFALVNNGKIETSKPRARDIKKLVERMIAIAKKDDLAARRRVFASMDADRETTNRIFSVIMPRYKDRTGGYLTLVALGRRLGDGAERVRIEWVGGNFAKKVEKVEKSDKVEKKETTKKVVKEKKASEK